ncbi:MAG: hypothetical protein QM820_14070 [Minicystis sp.]
MSIDLAWLLVLLIGVALTVALWLLTDGPVLRVPVVRNEEPGVPPSSTWPIGMGPHRDPRA